MRTRREFITLLGGAAVAWPLAARAQQADRMKRLGVLVGLAENDPEAKARLAGFRQAFERLGWFEGRNRLSIIAMRLLVPMGSGARERTDCSAPRRDSYPGYAEQCCPQARDQYNSCCIRWQCRPDQFWFC